MQPAAKRGAFIFEKCLKKKKFGCERNDLLFKSFFFFNYFYLEKKRVMWNFCESHNECIQNSELQCYTIMPFAFIVCIYLQVKIYYIIMPGRKVSQMVRMLDRIQARNRFVLSSGTGFKFVWSQMKVISCFNYASLPQRVIVIVNLWICWGGKY